MPQAELVPQRLQSAERVDFDQVQLLDWTARILVVATEILTLEEPQEIARKVKDALVQELGFSVVSILLADAAGALAYAADHGVSDQVKALGFRPGGTAYTAFAQGVASFVEDVSADGRVNPRTHNLLGAFATLPVHHRGRSYGVIMVTFMEPHPFPLIERVTLTAFAHQMGIAMDNGRLHLQERQRIAFLSAQADLAEALSTTLQRRDVVRILGETIRATAPSRAVAVWLQKGRELTLAFQSGFQEDAACRPVLAPGSSRVMAALSGDLLSQIPLAPVAEDLGLAPGLLPEDTQAFAMPLLCGGGLEGLLVFLAPGSVDPAMVRDMGDRSALALHNARLYEDSMAEASLDPLTGLSNRRAFLNAARPCVAGAARAATPLSVLMLDADHFKVCNDTYGHGVGDKVLVLLATIVRAQVRPSDLVGRLGGEEFAVVLKDANQDAAFRVAERIRLAMAGSRLDLGDGRVITVPTVSMGLAELDSGPATDLERLLERADAALYQAKDGGRNRTCRWAVSPPSPGEP